MLKFEAGKLRLPGRVTCPSILQHGMAWHGTKQSITGQRRHYRKSLQTNRLLAPNLFHLSLLLFLYIYIFFYLQTAAVSSWASAAVSGRGHLSRKAPPSPSWAPPFSGCSPPPPDRYYCQTQHWRRERHTKSGLNPRGSATEGEKNDMEEKIWEIRDMNTQGWWVIDYSIIHYCNETTFLVTQ